MSPSEYLELIQMVSDGTGAHAMNAVGILSAYIVVAHFAGHVLSRFQMWAITFIYSLFLTFPLFSIAGGFLRMRSLRLEFASEHAVVAQRYSINTTDFLGYAGPIILGVFVLAWATSLAFMYSVRLKAEKNK